jgi:NAD(P)-dependent dehydrogenase (short-subunit alcohol dehydrogenase family)
MRPIEEQTILITGATDGLGKALAADLAGRGATVLVHGRDDRRGESTLEEIRAAVPEARLEWYRADFASLAEVASLADAVGKDHPRLDVLVNNAGIGTNVPGGEARQESADGYELRFAVNYLAGYLLTARLLPAVERIVNVSSLGQMAIDFDDVMLTRDYSGVRAYCQSKLAQILHAFDLDESGVHASALHPATFMPTKIVARPTSSIEDGVRATARLVTDPENTSGRFFDGLREARADEQAYDAEGRARLRDLSEALTR